MRKNAIRSDNGVHLCFSCGSNLRRPKDFDLVKHPTLGDQGNRVKIKGARFCRNQNCSIKGEAQIHEETYRQI